MPVSDVQATLGAIDASKQIQQDYARLKALYPKLSYLSYTDLLKYDRENQRRAKAVVSAASPRTTWEQERIRQTTAAQQKRTDDAEKYNRALNLVGASNMSSKEARANPDAVKAIGDQIKLKLVGQLPLCILQVELLAL